MARKLTSPAAPAASVRRRRAFLFLLVCSSIALFFYYSSWELPGFLKDASSATLSRANIAQIMKSKNPEPKVDEIYGLLHLVTAHAGGDAEQLLTQVDPSQPIPMAVYASGEPKLDWKEEVARLNRETPVVVFSKSYCPFSRKAKTLLESYSLSPPPKVIEVDLREDANQIKQLLTRLTSHSTFPNIIVQGQSLRGSDNLQMLHQSQTLKNILERAGVEVGAVPA